MPVWHKKAVQTGHGTRWVLENDEGYQQHGGYLYDDEKLADRWVKILNAFDKAWGLQKGGTTDECSNPDNRELAQ